MRITIYVTSLVLVLLVAGFKSPTPANESTVIAQGQMPALVNEGVSNTHLVWGKGDSILTASFKNQGEVFSSPSLVTLLPGLAASGSRGPQVAYTENGVTIMACNKSGDIFSYLKDASGKWSAPTRVNDLDTTAKEGLMALSGEGKKLYAVWLDLRDKHNKIFGSGSSDGGKTWSKNKMIYASPDETVCECCKPSIVIKDNTVYVMFRNWLNGKRDMYLIRSADGGTTFGRAEKLGEGSWPLNGCPMDGGGIAVTGENKVQTTWRRQAKIYSAEPGKPEVELGEGRGSTLALINNQPLFAWTEKGEVVLLLPKAGKKVLGKGRDP
ncbi:MAG: exo-alpha-sialidase, partial [Chitinophagaceae bacterium]